MSQPFSGPSSESGDSPVGASVSDKGSVAGLRAKYDERVRECRSLKEELENAVRKEQELNRQLQEKQVILDYLEKKIFDQKDCTAFAESTPIPGRTKFFLPGVTPIFPPFARPPAHYQPANGTLPETSTPRNSRPQVGPSHPANLTAHHSQFVLSPSKYRMPNFVHCEPIDGLRTEGSEPETPVRRRADPPGEPIDCRKRKGTPVTSTLVLSKRGSGAAPIVIEEIFPELSGMCKPYVRICLVGGTKSFFCVHPNCNGRELNGNVWRKHYTSHFPEPDCRSPYHCPKCSQGFDLYRPLSKHFPVCGIDQFSVN